MGPRNYLLFDIFLFFGVFFNIICVGAHDPSYFPCKKTDNDLKNCGCKLMKEWTIKCDEEQKICYDAMMGQAKENNYKLTERFKFIIGNLSMEKNERNMKNYSLTNDSNLQEKFFKQIADGIFLEDLAWNTFFKEIHQTSFRKQNVADVTNNHCLNCAHKKQIVPTVKWPPPLILFWNPFFRHKTAMEWVLDKNNVSACPCQCRYSGDRSDEQNASVIIFHIRDEFGQLPAHRNTQQFYAFFLLESPIHSGGNHKNVPPDFFNISITYRADSDVFFPYDAFDPIVDSKNGLEQWKDEEIERKIGLKSKLAIQFVSNCHTNSRREKLVDELRQHMGLTEMGQCSGSGEQGCWGECYEKMIDEHFFYLAFENSVCQNYVTEKFWNIKRLIVSVVLSRKVFANLSVPEGAFIAADDFGNVKELAEYLEKVAADRQLYKRYFEWTKKFKKSEHRNGPQNAMCELCKLANEEPRQQKQIKNIVQFWENGQCQNGYAEKIARGK